MACKMRILFIPTISYLNNSETSSGLKDICIARNYPGPLHPFNKLARPPRKYLACTQSTTTTTRRMSRRGGSPGGPRTINIKNQLSPAILVSVGAIGHIYIYIYIWPSFPPFDGTCGRSIIQLAREPLRDTAGRHTLSSFAGLSSARLRRLCAERRLLLLLISKTQ